MLSVVDTSGSQPAAHDDNDPAAFARQAAYKLARDGFDGLDALNAAAAAATAAAVAPPRAMAPDSDEQPADTAVAAPLARPAPRPAGIPPALEREFDAASLYMLQQIRALEPSHPMLVHDLKQRLQDLTSVFAQVVDKSQDTTNRLLKSEAMELFLSKELEAHRKHRQQSEQRLQAHLDKLDALLTPVDSRPVATSESMDQMAKELAELRLCLEDNAAWQSKFHSVGQDNADLHEQVTTLLDTNRNLELRNHSLKQELTGRIQQLQLMSKGMATQDNEVYVKLLSELEHNTMKAIGQATARKALLAPPVAAGDSQSATNPADAASSSTAPAIADAGAALEPHADGAGGSSSSGTGPGRAVRSASTFKRDVKLVRSSCGLGFMIQGGAPTESPQKFEPVVVRQVYPDQPAAQSGRVFPGDLVLAINGTLLEGLLHTSIVQLIKAQGDEVVVTLLSHYHFPNEQEALQEVTPEEAMVLELVRQGASLLEKQEYDMALERLTFAIESAPNNVAAYTTRATVHLQTGRWERALSDCNAAIRISPSSALTYNRLGFACAGVGDLLSARDAHAKACQLDPHNEEFREALAEAEAASQAATQATAAAAAAAAPTLTKEATPSATVEQPMETPWERETSANESDPVLEEEIAKSGHSRKESTASLGSVSDDARSSLKVKVANVQNDDPLTENTAVFSTF
eukprot:m.488047 g.488047  ORF g.488047 m.488047 type:complete len:691 (+) comp25509_c0_seq1:62-2134(+)